VSEATMRKLIVDEARVNIFALTPPKIKESVPVWEEIPKALGSVEEKIVKFTEFMPGIILIEVVSKVIPLYSVRKFTWIVTPMSGELGVVMKVFRD